VLTIYCRYVLRITYYAKYFVWYVILGELLKSVLRYFDIRIDPVRATAVGRGAERDAERNTVLAGDPKSLVYYVMID